jgi:hypothetical protein
VLKHAVEKGDQIMRLTVRIAAGLVALAAVMTPGIASASVDVGPDKYGNMRNLNSNKCVDVRAQDDYYAAGARIQQYHCTGAREQQWAGHFVRNSPATRDDEYQFKVLRSGMCMQPPPGLSPYVDGNGVILVQEPCDETNELQLWYRYAAGTSWFDGWKNHRTGKCMDVRLSSTGDGAWIQQYTCNSTDSQVFYSKLETSNP